MSFDLPYASLFWIAPLVCLLTHLAMTWRQKLSFDSWGHLFFTLSVKREKCGPFGPINPKLAETKDFYYPLLVHWVLGFLPERVLLRASHLINPVAEALFLGLFIFIAHLGGIDTQITALAAGLYIAMPLIFSKVSIGPNVSQFTTRIYSELALTLFFLLAYLDIGLAWPVTLLLCSLIIMAIILSSKFGVQAVLLLGIGAGIITQNFIVLGAVAAGFGAAILLSRGHFLKMLKSQYAHLKWYFASLKSGTAFVSHRYDPRVIFQGLKGEPKKTVLQKLIFNIVGKNSYTALLIKAPLVTVFILLMVIGPSSQAVWFEGLSRLCWLSLAIFLLINTKWFILLGEAERYVSHIGFILALVVAALIMGTNMTGLAIGLLVYGLLYWGFEFILFGVLRFGVLSRDDEALLTFAQALPDDTVVTARPYHWFSPYQILAQTRLRTLFPILANQEGAQALQELEIYPDIRLDKLGILHDKHGLKIIFIETARLSEAERAAIENSDWTIMPYSAAKQTTILFHNTLESLPALSQIAK